MIIYKPKTIKHREKIIINALKYLKRYHPDEDHDVNLLKNMIGLYRRELSEEKAINTSAYYCYSSTAWKMIENNWKMKRV